MNGRYLLDTNIIIALFAQEEDVQQRLDQAEQVFLSSIVLGELYYGAEKSTRIDENIQRIDEFAFSTALIGCNQETARQYGRIKSILRAKGRPIPENDIWIAAQALQHQLTLVARDDHFQEVDTIFLDRALQMSAVHALAA